RRTKDQIPAFAGMTSKRGRRANASVLQPALAARRHRFDGHAEAARFAREHRAHAGDVAAEFLAALVADHHHHGVLERAVVRRVEGAFHLQRDEALGGVDRRRVELQVAAAGRADRRAFQDGGLAVRAGAGGACRARARRVHAALPLSLADALPSLSQPHSTWPRMREPAATVRVPALRSPLITPLCSSSTCCADSMLPSSSPARLTLLAATPPETLAPCSMVRLPCTLTSPLNLPAM